MHSNDSDIVAVYKHKIAFGIRKCYDHNEVIQYGIRIICESDGCSTGGLVADIKS